MYPTELCWITGEFNDECTCEFCAHKEECSGYEDYEAEEDANNEEENQDSNNK